MYREEEWKSEGIVDICHYYMLDSSIELDLMYTQR